MRLVFLDIDGVCNSAESITRQVWFRQANGQDLKGLVGIDPEYAERLNQIIERADAHLVLSSTWRLGADGPANTSRQLTEAGFRFSDRFVGNTPRLWEHRGVEIQAWLDYWREHHPEQPIESFVILDDDSDMDALMHRLVQTSWQHGLQDEHVERAVAMLTEPMAQPKRNGPCFCGSRRRYRECHGSLGSWAYSPTHQAQAAYVTNPAPPAEWPRDVSPERKAENDER